MQKDIFHICAHSVPSPILLCLQWVCKTLIGVSGATTQDGKDVLASAGLRPENNNKKTRLD